MGYHARDTNRPTNTQLTRRFVLIHTIIEPPMFNIRPLSIGASCLLTPGWSAETRCLGFDLVLQDLGRGERGILGQSGCVDGFWMSGSD